MCKNTKSYLTNLGGAGKAPAAHSWDSSTGSGVKPGQELVLNHKTLKNLEQILCIFLVKISQQPTANVLKQNNG